MMTKDLNIKPLVSVVVVTYNSSKTIIETLESIKTQTYKSIELVVSDDCSKDDTKKVVNQWLKDNGDRFVSAFGVFSDINTGIAANANRGIRKSNGKYIKAIAGDDCLISTAIEKYVDFLEKYDKQFCISNVEVFSGNNTLKVPESKIESYRRCFELCKESRENKLKRLAYEYVLLSPGYFFTREVYEKTGGYDERFPMSEEVPFAMRVLEAGYDMCHLDEKLVRYRYSGESLSQHHGRKLGNRLWFQDNRKIFYTYQFPKLVKTFRWFRAYSMMMQYEQTNLLYYDSVFARIGCVIIGLLNPYTYYTWIKRKLKR